MEFDELDQRMRRYETSHDHSVLPGIYMVARIDGRNFTRLTKETHRFERPFDERLTIYNFVEKKGTPHIAMEYVDGSSLGELLADGPLPIGRLLDFAKQLGDGVAKAHSAGIIHRDLKPENLMVTKDEILLRSLAAIHSNPDVVVRTGLDECDRSNEMIHIRSTQMHLPW